MSDAPLLTQFCLDALPNLHEWSGRPTTEALSALPGSPAVYLLLDAGGRVVQLATTQHLRRITTSRLTDADREKRGREDLAAVARSVRWRVVSSSFDARWWYYRLAREMFPRTYRDLISFGPGWFLRADWQAPAPEISVSERAWQASGEFVGPWPARKHAHEALEGLWDLFDLCRHPEQVRRAPDGQRCAYAEMGRCDAPCDGSVSLDAYAERKRAAWRFASGGVSEWITKAELRMKEHAANLEFEQAGLLKGQLEFARKWRDRWLQRVGLIEQFNRLLVVPVTRRKAWKLYLFARGELIDGPLVPDRKLVSHATNWLRCLLTTQPATPEDRNTGKHARPGDAVARMEQTWLVTHLLNNREAQTAMVIPLPTLTVPPHLGDSLEEALAQRRARPPESAHEATT